MEWAISLILSLPPPLFLAMKLYSKKIPSKPLGPGGYYIKVFNNDGNNYSIRDGKFHKKSSQVENTPQSHKQTEADSATWQKSRVSGGARGPTRGNNEPGQSWYNRFLLRNLRFLPSIIDSLTSRLTFKKIL